LAVSPKTLTVNGKLALIQDGDEWNRSASSFAKPAAASSGTVLRSRGSFPFTLAFSEIQPTQDPLLNVKSNPRQMWSLDLSLLPVGSARRICGLTRLVCNAAGIHVRELGRNTVRGPRTQQADIAMEKNSPCASKLLLGFRAEVFNLFNHTNYDTPTASLTRRSLAASHPRLPARVRCVCIAVEF